MDQSSAILFNPDGRTLKSANAVVSGRSRSYDVVGFEGTLSIKTVLMGEAVWETSDRRTKVDSGSYVVLNHGQRYSLEINSRKPVETFCVFFRPGYVEEIRGRSCEFDEELSLNHDVLARALFKLRMVTGEGALDSMTGDEAFRNVALALLGAQGIRTPHLSVRHRDEIIRLLRRARESMMERYAEDLSLEDVAREAGLSAHHFHHLFRTAFRETPHAFLTRRRLERARSLLAELDMPVESVCYRVGFRSISSFSKLFKSSFGCPPGRYRSNSEDSTIG